jgi:hypothetical protein
MPIYSFVHPSTLEEKEIVQSMNEPHVFIDEKGVEWRRLWTAPNARVDSDIDPFDSKAFVEKTKDKKESMGDIWDRSKEMSMKRAQKNGGKDPVKEKYLKDYSKSRKGRVLPSCDTD